MRVRADLVVDLGDIEAELRDEYGDEYEPSMLMPMAAEWAREIVQGAIDDPEIVEVDIVSEGPA